MLKEVIRLQLKKEKVKIKYNYKQIFNIHKNHRFY